jgi:hypothetical protein
MKRYSAKLLFQFRVVVNGASGKRRHCEEQIVLISARNAKDALSKAKRRGEKSQFDYLNDGGNSVYFEFIGVTDLLELGNECEPDEVWYDIFKLLLPSERRDKLIPLETELSAIKIEANRQKKRKR